MLLLSIAFLAGVLTLQWSTELPPALAYFSVFLVIPLWRWSPGRLPAVALLGFFWAGLQAELALVPSLDASIEGKTVRVTGKVLELPQQVTARQLRFLFYAERIDTGSGWSDFSGRVRLSWYGSGLVPAAGERWQFAVRLKRPHGFANPGGFDYERWLFQQGIRATGYIRTDREFNRRLTGERIATIHHFRHRLIAAYQTFETDSPALSLVRALSIGDRSAMSPSQWAVLRATGTSHLMAISGLHISLVTGLVFWLATRAWGCSAFLAGIVPARKAAAVIALFAALIYAMLAGFGIPTRRALIMVGTLMLAIISGRYTSLFQAIGLALVITLLVDSRSVLAPGWWLSFWAVMLIAWLITGRHGMQRPAQKWIYMHILLSIGMVPLLLVFFQQASLIAPLANMVAVPWVSLVVVPVVLLGTLLFSCNEVAGEFLISLSGHLLDLLWPLLEWLAGLEHALWQQHQPQAWTLIPALFGVFFILLPRGMPARWPGACLLLPLFLIVPAGPPPGVARITLLDVGQGLATVIQTRHHVLVYDAGPRFSETFDTGAAVVVPFLRQQGIRHLDRLIVSHGDNDHIGGVPSLLAAYPDTRILSSVPDELPGAIVEQCQSGQGWRWDGVQFTLLHPSANSGLTGNNASCVLRVEVKDGQSILLTGDIEQAAEQLLLLEQGERLASDVLVAPHHGSKTSSSTAFLRAVNPGSVLFPAGYRNRYGFPARLVVDRVAGMAAKMYTTGRDGALSLTLPSVTGHPDIQRYREAVRHYWQPENNP